MSETISDPGVPLARPHPPGSSRAVTDAPPGARDGTPDDNPGNWLDDFPDETAGRRSTLGEIAAELSEHRELLWQLTLRDLRLRYKQAVMGFGWAVLMPVLVILSGLVVRVAMAHLAGSDVSAAEVGGLAVKAVAWSFFVGAITFGTQSLVSNVVLVTKVYFAREVLPLAAVLAQCVDAAVGGAAVGVTLLVLGVRPGVAWLWVPLLVALLVGFTAAVALFLSCANLFFRDVKYIVQVLITFGIFFTPVLFEPAAFGPLGARVLMLNPLSPLLEGLRLALVAHHDLLAPLVTTTARGARVVAWTPWYLAYTAAWTLLGLPAAAALFHKMESVFAERV